jgi:uncharacterized protein with PQ loop repeat
MLSSYLAGLMMWLIYGIMLKAMAVVVANAASAALVAAAIAMKAMIRSQSQRVPGGESA